MSKVDIIVPCYNEEEVITTTCEKLTSILQKMISKGIIESNSKIILVDDGSSDATWGKILEISKNHTIVCGVKLSKNFGHQYALLAGMTTAYENNADAIISIDADLQDDPMKMFNFVNEFNSGYDIVYGVRDQRDTDTLFKKTTAGLFYFLMDSLGTSLVPNHADYRLLSRRALKALLDYKEENLFLRGIVPTIGFSSTKVFYRREARIAGESKYPLRKMIAFALDGITSFSSFPLKLVTYMGFMSFLIGFIMFIYAVYRKVTGGVVLGWTSLMTSVWILGGIQLLSLGVIGEYIGKTFVETKRRPRYFVDHIINK